MRILLADDHKIVRDGLRSCLAGQPRFEVVGEAADGQQAVELARSLRADLVVMDLAMPGLNGIEATRQIVADRSRRTRVIILSMHSDPEFVAEAFRAGAWGYVLKSSAFEELLTAIQTVAGGQRYISPSVAGALVSDLTRTGNKPSPFRQLTARERQILQLLAEGLSAKEIAYKLKISDKTVHTFRAKIMQKLNLHSIAALTKYAIRQGLVSLDH